MSIPIPAVNEVLSCLFSSPRGIPHTELRALAGRHGLDGEQLADAVCRSGYLLQQEGGYWQLEPSHRPHDVSALAQSLAEQDIELCYRPVTGSTNTDALQDDFDLPARVHLVECQFSGRGQKGRRWHARPSASLLFSLSLPWNPDPDHALVPAIITLQAGLLLRSALPEPVQQRIRIKWPNDLVAGRAKLAGILAELRQQGHRGRLVIGVGMNVHVAPKVPARETIAMEALMEAVPDRDALLLSCVSALQTLAVGRVGMGLSWSPEIDALWGRHVTCSDGREGVGAGLAPDGGYRLRAQDGEHVLCAADNILGWR
ncbi:MAG: biotin--[acetyl-CoA-carboxylase] ligase [Gammaproteobacteria bacterium]|nr:MAG: biotin--[acetyl-CoA-carboxylase] ligase [Gammaproteobacteria bacterium]